RVASAAAARACRRRDQVLGPGALQPALKRAAGAAEIPTDRRRRSFPRLTEVSQIRRRLVLAGWHQGAIPASEIEFLADTDVVVVLGAKILGPDRIVLAMVISGNRPGAGEGIVDGRDLVMQ